MGRGILGGVVTVAIVKVEYTMIGWGTTGWRYVFVVCCARLSWKVYANVVVSMDALGALCCLIALGFRTDHTGADWIWICSRYGAGLTGVDYLCTIIAGETYTAANPLSQLAIEIRQRGAVISARSFAWRHQIYDRCCADRSPSICCCGTTWVIVVDVTSTQLTLNCTRAGSTWLQLMADGHLPQHSLFCRNPACQSCR